MFEEIAKFSWKFFKNCKFFENFSGIRGGSAPGTPTLRPPYKPSLGGPRFPRPEKIPAGANGLHRRRQKNFQFLFRWGTYDIFQHPLINLLCFPIHFSNFVEERSPPRRCLLFLYNMYMLYICNNLLRWVRQISIYCGNHAYRIFCC